MALNSKKIVARGRIHDENGQCNKKQELDTPVAIYAPELEKLTLRLDQHDNLPFWMEIDIPESVLVNYFKKKGGFAIDKDEVEEDEERQELD